MKVYGVTLNFDDINRVDYFQNSVLVGMVRYEDLTENEKLLFLLG